MIIKLNTSFATHARHREEKVAKPPLTYKERIRTDRLVMVILLGITIIAAVIYA